MKGATLGGAAHAATSLAEGDDPTLSGVATGAGLGAVLGGAFGAAAPRGTKPQPVPQPKGFLRAAPGYVAGPSGEVAPFGTDIPMAHAPDGSFVRGVPAEYARREVRALLPEGRAPFIAGEGGQVAAPGTSADAFTSALHAVRSASRESASEVKGVPAAIAGREFDGRTLTNTIYSGDPHAVDAPLIDLTPDEQQGLRWLREELSNLPFTKRTFIEGPARRGGDLEVIPGGAGAPIYDDIVQVRGSHATRGEVVEGIDKLLNGQQSAVGQDALKIARRLMTDDGEVRGRMYLPREAGDATPANPDALRVQRLEHLPQQQRAVQERAASALERGPDPFISAYRDRFDNVVSADLAKELFPEYTASRQARTLNTLAVHRPSSVVAHKVFEQMLQEPPPPGRDALVVFTGGGTGSGKSTGLATMFPTLQQNAHIVYDSTLANPAGAVRDVRSALDAGHEVGVVFTYRDVIDAFRNGVLPRTVEEGRSVTMASHARTHTRALESLQRIQAEFSGDPRVIVMVVDNTGPAPTLRHVEELANVAYNEIDVRRQLQEVLDSEYAAGRIPEDVYRATHGPSVAEVSSPRDRGRAELQGLASAQADPLTHRHSEFGGIPIRAAMHVGGGVGGAAFGAATGDDPNDRLERAALFGAAGAAGPGVLRGGFLRSHTLAPQQGRLRVGQGLSARTPVPGTGDIPAHRLLTMPVLTDDVQDAADDILARHGGFERQRRGVQSVPRTEGLADRIAVPTDTPLRAGTALNAERMRAYQNATATILRKQRALEDAVKSGKGTPADELELARVKSEAEVLTASFRGAAAEAGRALHILRYQSRILQSGDPEAIKEAAQYSRHGVQEQAQSVFYANILSGIQTHERNVLGNLSNAIYSLAAHPFAVGADAVRSVANGQPRQVFLGELPERIAGTVAALPRAFGNALRAARTGVAASDVTTFDRPAIREFQGGGANPFNWPKRALESVDDFFSTVAAEQTLYGAAFAQAKREGVSGQRLLDRVAELKVHPSDEILSEVQSQRARLLFREKPGRIADAVLAAKRHLPLLGYVAPFVRVPANIIRQGFEASPLGFGMPAARAGGRSGADAMGRAAAGSLALAPLAYYAALGKITGDAPADPAKRAAFYESGKRPNSILIGETWYSYQTVQPLNVPLAIVANGFQAWREAQGDPDTTADQIATSIIGGTASSLLDQSFLSGVSALVDALGDPERYGRRFVQQLATGFVPLSGFLRTVAHATDPIVRNPKSVMEGVQAIIPGQGRTLEPRLTRFGEPVPRVEGALNVFKRSPVVNDPVASMLDEAGVDLRPAQGPQDVTVARGVKLPLERSEQFAAGQASGRVMRQVLERLQASPVFQRASPVQQQRLIEHAIAQSRDAVRQQLVREAVLDRLGAR